MRAMRTVADRMLTMFVPKATAQAACSGSWTFCHSAWDASCSYMHGKKMRAIWKCTYKPNCTDTCSNTGTCCL
ncbi:hypothetical protein [Actinoplanes flavus]|uniref:Secreted protein n=1 Tax=Actinoplanes flavus TaxID=2820290 RepID=A0ABS3UDW9_9ACTN|nr:hypothetical protein [Actinoplanes flavus]MBO3736970.1 hypothetical protein [Actinoplanes flavus]